jgi:hypothetical protein
MSVESGIAFAQIQRLVLQGLLTPEAAVMLLELRRQLRMPWWRRFLARWWP